MFEIPWWILISRETALILKEFGHNPAQNPHFKNVSIKIKKEVKTRRKKKALMESLTK